MTRPPLVPRRLLGNTGIWLSAFSLGTMGLGPDRLSRNVASDVVARLVERGVDCFHTSTEYDSFGFFAELFALTRALFPDKQFRIIGKVGVPHFGEEGFSPARFETEVDRYLLGLKIDCLDIVQWSLRYDLNREDRRLEIFSRDAETIGRTVERLREAGKLRAVVSFPYTMRVGLRALCEPWCDGLALYVNPLERSLDPLLDETLAVRKGVLGIRPFAAGRVFGAAASFDGADSEVMDRLTLAWADAEPVGRALGYALAHPAVATAIASVSSRQHAIEASGRVAAAGIDMEGFKWVSGG